MAPKQCLVDTAGQPGLVALALDLGMLPETAK
jgi:hypothetical protein